MKSFDFTLEPPIQDNLRNTKMQQAVQYATAQWARTNYDKKADIQVKGVDRLLVGHSPTGSGGVEVHGNTVYADLGSFFRDKVSFIQLM